MINKELPLSMASKKSTINTPQTAPPLNNPSIPQNLSLSLTLTPSLISNRKSEF